MESPIPEIRKGSQKYNPRRIPAWCFVPSQELLSHSERRIEISRIEPDTLLLPEDPTMKPLLAAAFGLALLCASCDSGSDSPASDPTPVADNHASLLLGKWAPVINSGGQYFDFRDRSHLVVQIRSGFLNDSVPFGYTTSGSSITLITATNTDKGTFRFFGNDSVELKFPNLFSGLCKRIETIPAP